MKGGDAVFAAVVFVVGVVILVVLVVYTDRVLMLWG